MHFSSVLWGIKECGSFFARYGLLALVMDRWHWRDKAKVREKEREKRTRCLAFASCTFCCSPSFCWRSHLAIRLVRSQKVLIMMCSILSIINLLILFRHGSFGQQTNNDKIGKEACFMTLIDENSADVHLVSYTWKERNIFIIWCSTMYR